MTTYDVSCSKERLLLRPGESDGFELTVSNAAERASTCLCHVEIIDRPPADQRPRKRRAKDAGKAPVAWQHDKQRDLEAGQTASWSVRVDTTRDADPGDYRVQVLLADEANPDEHFATIILPMLLLPAKDGKGINWWLVIACLMALLLVILLIVILTGGTRSVPLVVGQPAAMAVAQLEDAGFTVETRPTSFAELDSVMVPALKRERELLLLKRAADGDEAARRRVYDLQNGAEPGDLLPVQGEVVWQQGDARELASGAPVVLAVAPAVAAIPPVIGLDVLEAGRQLAEAGFRFAVVEEVQADAGYGPHLRAGQVWDIRPGALTDWSSFWPADPAVAASAAPSDQTDQAERVVEQQLYRGYRIELQVNPTTIQVPDVINRELSAVLIDPATRALNIEFIYNRQVRSREEMQQIQQGLLASGRRLTIYQQEPEAGRSLPSYPHRIRVWTTGTERR